MAHKTGATIAAHQNVFQFLLCYASLIIITGSEIYGTIIVNEGAELSVRYPTTLCLKKVPTFKLSVILSSLNRFLKFLHCWKVY